MNKIDTKRRLRVLIFGAGKVGLTLGGFLSREHEVTLLGRKHNLQPIQNKGLTIDGIWGRHHFRLFHKFATHVREISEETFDVVLLTVKAYDTFAAAKSLSKRISSQTLMVSLQNGLGNIETLHKFFPKKQVLAGRVIFGAKMPKPGQIEITVMAEPTAIGETYCPEETPRVKRLAEIFNRAGVPSVSCGDIQKRIWAKVSYNCALNPLAALLDCHYGRLMEKEETRNVMNCVIEEIYAIAKKARISLQPETSAKYQKLFYSQLVPRTYHHHPSMLQDLREGKRTEIDSLNGAVMRLGQKFKIPVPINQMLTEMILEKEKSK